MVGHKVLVIGLPGSGKTTFIAALWHLVQANEVPSALRLESMTGDRTYLNDLRDAWLQCNPMPRTTQRGEKLVSMLLTGTTGASHELFLPDISGETFREQWARREWTKEYDDLVANADGVLIFVRPGAVIEPLSLVFANQVAGEISPGAAESSAPEVGAEVRSWDPIESPTQAQLVDLLQLLAWRRPGLRWRVGIVVSAWDEARELGQTPEQWCQARLPLLYQYIGSNSHCIRVRHYGVSAQGGTLPSDAHRLKAFVRPSARIEVVSAGRPASHDITLPVYDLLAGEDNEV